MKTAIIGGGAAGFFLAINLKEMCPQMEVTIFEKSKKVLAKVEVSGGGRCNCTNSFAVVSDLSQVYPRGHRLMKRLFKTFDHRDAYAWFERHGVRLVTQDYNCVFPASQDSHTIINLFLAEARRHGIDIRTKTKITSLDELKDFDYIAITTGGGTAAMAGVPVIEPVPSLFTFSIADEALRALMGTVVENATAFIPGTSFRASGPLLITHWGMSGPAILRLSSYGARHLAEQGYASPLRINWTGETDAEAVRLHIIYLINQNAQRLIDNLHPYDLQTRLWTYLLSKVELQGKRCNELGKKGINRLVELLTNDTYTISGRSPYKDEFVTCGGISLDEVNKQTLESKQTPNLFYAGEVLDIDGVTGGFNFQAAWTTAYAVAKGITKK